MRAKITKGIKWASILLAVAALYAVFNEGSDNWQSLWTCAVYFLFAVTLWRARAVQIPK